MVNFESPSSQSNNEEAENQAETSDGSSEQRINVDKYTLHDIKQNFNFDDAVPDEIHSEGVKECIKGLISGEVDPNEEYESSEYHGASRKYESPIAFLQKTQSLSVLKTIEREYDLDLPISNL